MAVLPIIIPLAGAGVAMLLRGLPRAQRWWSLGTLIVSFAVCVLLLMQVLGSGQPLKFQLGGWVAPFGISIVADALSVIMIVMVQFVMLMGCIYTLGASDATKRYSVYMPIYLTLTTALTGAMLTGDTFNLFVFVELMVISAAALTAMSDDRSGTEAAFKYFYVSQLATIFLLSANGLIYMSYGSLNMADLAQRIKADAQAGGAMPPMLIMAMVCFFATFMIKSAAFPFHFWQPDFHAAAPTAVSAVLSSVVVKAGVYGFIRMTTQIFVPYAPQLQQALIVIGVIGVIFGGFSAYGTHHAKRMFAYSTLAQIGFMLVAIGWGGVMGIAAAIVFMVNHALIKSAMLMLSGYLASKAPVKSASFEVIKGLGKSLPYAGVLFFLGSMALAGLPPLNGFIGKLMVFQLGIAQAQWGWLALIGVASFLTIVYTMRSFQWVWFLPPEANTKAKAGGDALLAPSILVLSCIALGVFGDPLVNMAMQAGAWVNR
jgi:multicomponent Na+:H+ antiporter subunit D